MTRAEVRALIERLERDYRDQFIDAGAVGFDGWVNNAKVGVEARFGEHGGPAWSPSVRHAARTGWLGLFGPFAEKRSAADVERELRSTIEAYLQRLRAGYRPTLFRRRERG